MDPKVADAVVERAEGCCEALTPDCIGRTEVIHHRRLRGQGGKDTTENLLHICNPCHIWIHHNVADAAEWGLILRAGQ